MKWYTKIKNWIKNIFKKTEFDNKLFAIGVEKLKVMLKEELKEVDGIVDDKFFEHVKELANKKFGHIKVVKAQLDNIIEFAKANVINLKGFMNGTVNAKINLVCDKMVKWYDKNL